MNLCDCRFFAKSIRSMRIKINQRFAPKDAAYAHKALEARATSGSTVVTI